LRSDSARGQRFLEHLEPLQTVLEAYCRRHLLDGSSVEDILQTVVTLAFRDFHRFAEGTNFRAWIFRYLNLEIRNRKHVAEQQRLEPLDDPADAARHTVRVTLLRLRKRSRNGFWMSRKRCWITATARLRGRFGNCRN